MHGRGSRRPRGPPGCVRERHTCDTLWIDQLSIDQENKIEKKIAMQSMDLVYKHCTYAVGCLWTQLRTRHQVNLLISLLRGKIVSESRGSPTLARNIGSMTAYDTFSLIRSIVGASWWERAWILQEDYLAGLKMWLLIRCRDNIQPLDLEDTLYSLPGEIIIKSVDFKKYASLFCLAYLDETSEPDVRLECEKILSKAGKYNILHVYDEGKMKDQALTLHILEDLKGRKIRNRSDFPAIISNACDYNMRIDTASRRSQHRSLSLAILAQHVGNGELINNNKDYPGNTSGNVFEFLQHQSLQINAPFSTGALSFKKHCRLCVLRLSRTGVHAEGILWELSRDIWQSRFRRDTNLEYGAPDTTLKDQNRLSEYHRYHLDQFISFLTSRGYQTLAEDIKRHLLADENLTPVKREDYDEWSPIRCKNIMAAHIVNAIITGRCIRLGRLYSQSYTPYRAAFVCDELSAAGTDCLIFTSWNRTKEKAKEGRYQRSLAKFASLEVELDGKRPDGIPRLRIRQWINGLCFFRRESMFEVCFPWPGSLF